MPTRVTSTTTGQPPRALFSISFAEPSEQGSAVVFMRSSRLRPPSYRMCPILLVQYQVTQNGNKKHHSFGFLANSFRTVEINLDPSNAALPAIVWEGKESVLGLVFPTETARAKCIKRLGKDKPFGLSLERDLQASFLLRNFNGVSPGDDVELYQVQGKNQTIMSIRAGQRGFVVVARRGLPLHSLCRMRLLRSRAARATGVSSLQVTVPNDRVHTSSSVPTRTLLWMWRSPSPSVYSAPFR